MAADVLDRFDDSYWRVAVRRARAVALRRHDQGPVGYHRRHAITATSCPICAARRAR